MPNRTTRDYEGPAVAPKIQAALDAALMDEDDIDLDANDIKYRTCLTLRGDIVILWFRFAAAF